MKKLTWILPALSLMIALPALADDGDLTLPGERWLAVFEGYVCDQRGTLVDRPTPLTGFDVRFDRLTTDYSLDNALLKATFVENGAACRYSAILLADNAAGTSKLVQSRASAPEGGSDCAQGKALLDAGLTANKYLYYGHPHRIAFMMPGVGADSVCGADAQTMGPAFVVKGKITR